MGHAEHDAARPPRADGRPGGRVLDGDARRRRRRRGCRPRRRGRARGGACPAHLVAATVAANEPGGSRSTTAPTSRRHDIVTSTQGTPASRSAAEQVERARPPRRGVRHLLDDPLHHLLTMAAGVHVDARRPGGCSPPSRAGRAPTRAWASSWVQVPPWDGHQRRSRPGSSTARCRPGCRPCPTAPRPGPPWLDGPGAARGSGDRERGRWPWGRALGEWVPADAAPRRDRIRSRAGGATGSSTTKRAPPAGLVAHPHAPRWRTTIDRTTARPRPAPPRSRPARRRGG